MAQLRAFGPMERLFAAVESMAGQYASALYDPTWGYPTHVRYAWPPAFDVALSIVITDFQILTGPVTAEGVDPAALTWPWRQGFGASIVVEATIVGPLAPWAITGGGWLVTVEDPDVLYLNGVITPTEGYIRASQIIITEVGDRALYGPRTLRGMEGERLILLLSPSGDPDRREDPALEVRWAARRTDNGLEFIGPRATFTSINEDFPTLCGPIVGPRDTDEEVDLLIRLIDSVHWDWEDAVEAACNPEG